MTVVEILAGGRLLTGALGSALWLWAEWDWRNIGYAPMWWRVLYPVILGPVGLLIGGSLALSRWLSP